MLFFFVFCVLLDLINGKCNKPERGISETCRPIKLAMFQLGGIILDENDEIYGRFRRQSDLIDDGYDNLQQNPNRPSQFLVSGQFPQKLISKNVGQQRLGNQSIRSGINNQLVRSKVNKTGNGNRQPVHIKFQKGQQRQRNQKVEKPGIIASPEFSAKNPKTFNNSRQKTQLSTNFSATKYYYPPKRPLPLLQCFYNPSGYVCCNEDLNNLMVSTVEKLLKKSTFNPCNIGAISTAVQKEAEEKFQTKFEAITGLDDFAQSINFADDLVCKIEINGKIILTYASSPSDEEKQTPEFRIRRRRQITKIRI